MTLVPEQHPGNYRLAEGDLPVARDLAKAFAARYPNDTDLRWLMKEAERIMKSTDEDRPLRPGTRRRSSG